MRRLLIVGAVSMASALGAACGDDGDSNPLGTGGSGGTGGNGGSSSAGAAGSSGLAGSGGTAGTNGGSGSSGGGAGGSSGASGSGNAGSGNAGTNGNAGTGSVVPDAGSDASTGDAGDGGAPPPCTGCMELRVPFTAVSQAAFFQIQFSARSLADTVVTIRVGAEVLDQTGETFVQTFATDSESSGFSQITGAFTLINAANFTNTSTFIDLTLDFPNLSNVDFDEADVIALGLQLGSGANLAGPTTSVLKVDSITFTGTSGLTNLSFASDAEGFARNAFAGLQTAEAIHHPE